MNTSRRVATVLFGALIVALLGGSVACATTHASDPMLEVFAADKRGAPCGGFTLTASYECYRVYKPGRPLELILSLRNVSKEDRVAYITRPDLDYTVLLEDDKGHQEIIHSTSTGDADYKSSSQTLQPGGAILDVYRIGDYRKFTQEGKYRLTVARKINNLTTPDWVVSNTIDLLVSKNDKGTTDITPVQPITTRPAHSLRSDG